MGKRTARKKGSGPGHSGGAAKQQLGGDKQSKGGHTGGAGAELFAKACELHQRGDLKGAEGLYGQALEQDAELVDAWRNLGAMLRQQGRSAEGLKCSEQALKRRPNDQSLWGNLGNVLRDLGRLDESQRAFERAIQLAPELLGPRLGLAITLNRSGDYWPLIQGMTPLLDGLPAEPNGQAADLLLEVGNAYHHLGNGDQALLHWKRALAMAKGDQQLLMVLNTAQVLCEQQQHGQAEELLRQQLEHHPNHSNLVYALGVTAKGQGRWEEACQLFEKALQIDANYVICLNTYGLLLRDLGRSHQARSCFERALAVDPEFGAAMNNLGSVLKDVARYPEALSWLRKGAEKLGDNPAAQSNVLFTLVGYELEPPEQRFAAAKRFGERFANAPFERWRDRIPHPDPKRRLRVGLLSPDFCRHAVSYFIEPLLEQWDRNELEISLYACGNVRDDYTRRLQGKADRWRDLHGLNDEQACLQILRDEIDILVDLAGHTAGNRLQLVAQKPAPIQATYLGYYGTTGLAQVDYWITDNTLHPPGREQDDPATEEHWRLPRAYLTYRPLPEAPAVAPLPLLKRGHPMLGSFNQSRKITATTAERWMAVLEAIPEAHLFLKSKNLGEPVEAERVRELFGGLGLAAERLHLEGHSPSVAVHLDRYREMDLALDTFPYTGCTTSADALWMGVPVLTVAGQSMVSRQAAAVLTAAGRAEWICHSKEQLVELCQELLSKPEQLAQLRAQLRGTTAQSELLDHQGLAATLSQSFRSWWQVWLAKQFPEPEQGNQLDPWPLMLPPPALALRCPYPR
ncbi:tetratricopeptide repeat protein [Cyanobium sp. HWJ4-Hawea]|uniref:tetratricopeptide repeat protein n=1 Tax=Cyanobium sp. HWJ4-Hawea TaxID=2823713 RepID=UPI0020CBC2B1|nr:tetratricopeptide repeat protein [Cyanobium sp. HWJ4-Hawea]MCP9809130.1 tetratricopeptide repeat protein [Cyanobium sp. HWJ4-Hawea]